MKMDSLTKENFFHQETDTLNMTEMINIDSSPTESEMYYNSGDGYWAGTLIRTQPNEQNPRKYSMKIYNGYY